MLSSLFPSWKGRGDSFFLPTTRPVSFCAVRGLPSIQDFSSSLLFDRCGWGGRGLQKFPLFVRLVHIGFCSHTRNGPYVLSRHDRKLQNLKFFPFPCRGRFFRRHPDRPLLQKSAPHPGLMAVFLSGIPPPGRSRHFFFAGGSGDLFFSPKEKRPRRAGRIFRRLLQTKGPQRTSVFAKIPR